MPVPNKIKIKREPDYHTHFIGKTEDGRQFMALVTATIPSPVPEDWEQHKKWYAVFHSFDAEGRHLDTKAVCTGRTADGEDQVVEKAKAMREQMLAEVGKVSFEDIETELFSVTVDGFTFGLVDVSSVGEKVDRIDLLPNELTFSAPWNGEYVT